MSGGDKARTNNEHFKAVVAATLDVKGFTQVSKEGMEELLNWDAAKDGPRPRRNVYYRGRNNSGIKYGINLFGRKRNCSMVYFNGERFRVIEVRWQGGSGTTYEKFPLFVANASLGGIDTIFVLGGDGLKKPAPSAAAAWLKTKAHNSKHVLEVFFEEEFIAWANDENL